MEFRRIGDQTEIDAVLAAPLAVVYKHSPVCGLSTMAADQLRTFAEAHPEVPVYLIDVVRERALAREVADRTEVRHESPQVLLIRDGAVVWDASHRGVQADALAREAARVE